MILKQSIRRFLFFCSGVHDSRSKEQVAKSRIHPNSRSLVFVMIRNQRSENFSKISPPPLFFVSVSYVHYSKTRRVEIDLNSTLFLVIIIRKEREQVEN